MADGCFDHSVYEFEPGKGTVITNALADLGLLHQAEHTEDRELKERIFRIVKHHFDWFNAYWWQWGNTWKKGVDYPAWCAVTNQDLSVAYAMLKYGQLSGDMSYFDRYAKPVTLWIMENAYHPDLAMFDRGDAPDFLERVGYCGVIDRLLLGLNLYLKDDRITKAVLRNLDTIIENTWTDEYGCLRLPGAFELNGEVKKQPSDVFVLVDFIPAFDILKKQYEVDRYEEVKQELLKTLLFYQSEFGSVRGDTRRGDIIDLVPTGIHALSLLVSYWQGSKLPQVERPDMNLVVSQDRLWAEDCKTWLIRDKERMYSGVKKLPNGIYRDNRVKGLEKVLVEKDRVKVVLNGEFTGNWVSVELVGEGLRSVSVEGIERNIKVTCKD